MSKPGLAVAIDAGSHSLKGLILGVPKNGSKTSLPNVLKKKFIKIPVAYDQQLPADYQAKLASKLGEFILEMSKEGLKNSDRIVIGLGPSLAGLSIEKHSIKVVGKERVLTMESAKSYFKNMGGGGAIAMDVLVNGYKFDSKETGVPNNFELAFRVMVPQLAHEVSVVVDETKKALGGLTLDFFPNPYLQQVALVKGLKAQEALLVDVGGENTQTSILKNGSILQTYSFPIGARHFIRGMAKIAGITYEEAEDIKKQYTQNLVDGARKKQIHLFLVEESKLWYKMFVEGMDNFYHFGPLPMQVFMFGGGANLAEIADTVRKGDWTKNNSFNDYPKVNILGGESIFEGNTFDGYLRGPEDFNLASMVYYLSNGT
ncbi:MAG: cell division FtsA domain-containing protein [bacterium]|nr:cell division FtsA domain-containing protein [bacterium]